MGSRREPTVAELEHESNFKHVIGGGVRQPKLCPTCGKNIFYQYLGEDKPTEMYVGRCNDCAWTIRVKGGPQ